MIRPTKYMRLDQCVLTVAALLARELEAAVSIPLPEIEAITVAQLGETALSNLPHAINVLYLTGVVEYDPAGDALMLAPSRYGATA